MKISNLILRKTCASISLCAASLIGCSCTLDEENDDVAIYNKENVIVYDDVEEVSPTPITVEYLNKEMYTNVNLNIRSGEGTTYDKVDMIDSYDTFYAISKDNDWTYVEYDGIYGYVASEYTIDLGDEYIEIDISSQNLVYYKDGNVIVESDVVSGNVGNHDTHIGMFSIYGKDTDTYLRGPGYKSYVNYWMPFNGGEGLHDATWRDDFGENIYQGNGSHGCINLPLNVAELIYEESEVGTKVLVHK